MSLGLSISMSDSVFLFLFVSAIYAPKQIPNGLQNKWDL